MNDDELLRAYVKDRSEAAFAGLVQRYVNLVYSSASRQLRNPHDADDATQAVFLLLARKAGSLRGGSNVPGWLMRATHFACRGVIRGKLRRKRHEQDAAMATPSHQPSSSRHSSEPDWDNVAPQLDEAVAGLNEQSRTALVLRFFENMPYKQIAQRLAIAEPAARKRVERAVEQLKAFYARRNIALPTAGLEALINAHGIVAAPKGLALAAAANAKAAAPSALSMDLARRAARSMISPAAKVALAACIVIAVAGGGFGLRAMLHHSADSSSDVGNGAFQSTETAAHVRGRVLDSDGSPVNGAEVMLARVSSPVALYGPQREGVLEVVTGVDGTYDFPAQSDATALLARADAGFTQVLLSNLPADGTLTLRPWGHIEGMIKINGKPATGQIVELSRADGTLEEWNAWHIMHDTRTVTDPLGHYTFLRAASFPEGTPGRLAVHCGDRWRMTRLAPRETALVDIGGDGRAVGGKLAITDPNLPSFIGYMYREELPTTPHPPTTAPTKGPKPVAAPVLPDSLDPPPRVVVHADGTFRAEDVPPGFYQFYFRSSVATVHSAFPDDIASGMATVTVPKPSSKNGDAPIDVGVVRTHANTLLWPGQPAPDFQFAGTGNTTVRLADYKGKYLLLYVRDRAVNNQLLTPQSLGAVYDRFCDDPNFAMLEVTVDSRNNLFGRMPQDRSEPWPAVSGTLEMQSGIFPSILTRLSSARTLPRIYLNSPTSLFLIDPAGKCAARNLNARVAISEIAKLLPHQSPATSPSRVHVAHRKTAPADAPDSAGPFPNVPDSSDPTNIARAAHFVVVDGMQEKNSGRINVLNDGKLPTESDQPASNFFFDGTSLEGRFRIDLLQPTLIQRIDTWSWHTGHRAPQVYTVYGSDGSAPQFNPAPKAGIDPARCGWTRIADVDTRPQKGPDGGQYAVSISDPAGPLGRFKYLLFVSFVTETEDNFGHTFYSEIDVIRQPEARP